MQVNVGALGCMCMKHVRDAVGATSLLMDPGPGAEQLDNLQLDTVARQPASKSSCVSAGPH
jgi:hypothetical protein